MLRIAIVAIVLLSAMLVWQSYVQSPDDADGSTQSGIVLNEQGQPPVTQAGLPDPPAADVPALGEEPRASIETLAESVPSDVVVAAVPAGGGGAEHSDIVLNEQGQPPVTQAGLPDPLAEDVPAPGEEPRASIETLAEPVPSDVVVAAVPAGDGNDEPVALRAAETTAANETVDNNAAPAKQVKATAEDVPAKLPVVAGPLDSASEPREAPAPVVSDEIPGPATDAAVYIDQLIDPAAIEADSLYPDFEDAAEPEGFRSYSTEYRHYQQDIDNAGKSYEDGMIFHARRETRDYGEFELLATLRNDRPSNDSPDDDTTGGRLTVRQYGFALNEDWLLDNSAGVLRSDSDPALSSSYRFNLPSTLVSGLKNWSRNETTQLRFSAGKIGTLGTGRIEDFDTTSGTLASMNVSHALDDRWLVSGQVIALNDSDEVQDHETGAVALQYQTDDKRHSYVGHTLMGSDGGDAVWLDGDNQFGRWRQRYGVFWLEPDLLWSDASLTDDKQGIYTRSELRSQRYNLTIGTDFNENNINDNNALPKNRFSNVFISGNRRLLRTTGIGGTASYLEIDPRNAAAGDDSRIIRLTGYVQQRFSLGDTRLEITGADIEKNNDNGNIYGVTWDQNWDVYRWLRLSTTLAHEQSSGLSDNEKRDSASVLFTHDVTPELQWNGSASYAHVKTDSLPGRDNYNVVLGGAWQFLPNWAAHLDLTWSRAEENTGVLDDLFDIDEKTLLLRVKHTIRTGRPFVTAGNKTGLSGYGEVSGAVFYDDNRDGVRQAGERAARGIFVYLDNRYERVTDNEGRYTFKAVSAGEHSVTIAVEDLPLPWVLEDDKPQPVTVTVRGVAEVDFALTRIIQ